VVSMRGYSSDAHMVRQIRPLVATSSSWEELAVFTIAPDTYPTLWPTIPDSLQVARRLTCLTLSHTHLFGPIAAPGVPPEVVTLDTVREIRYKHKVQEGIATPNAESLSLLQVSFYDEQEFRGLCGSMPHLKKIQLQAVFINRTWAERLSPRLSTKYSEREGALRTDVNLCPGPISVVFTGKKLGEYGLDGCSMDDALLFKFVLATANVQHLKLHLREKGGIEASFESLFVDHRWFQEARARGLTTLHIRPERYHRIQGPLRHAQCMAPDLIRQRALDGSGPMRTCPSGGHVYFSA
jgi:hypothetical protein